MISINNCALPSSSAFKTKKPLSEFKQSQRWQNFRPQRMMMVKSRVSQQQRSYSLTYLCSTHHRTHHGCLLYPTDRADRSREVRRAAMLNISITARTLPTLLTRTRDVDTTNRKLVYTAVLSNLEHPN